MGQQNRLKGPIIDVLGFCEKQVIIINKVDVQKQLSVKTGTFKSFSSFSDVLKPCVFLSLHCKVLWGALQHLLQQEHIDA